MACLHISQIMLVQTSGTKTIQELESDLRVHIHHKLFLCVVLGVKLSLA